MPGRIVLFGATGYTGRLTVKALLRRGLQPVLAARSAEKLEELNRELDGPVEVAVADSSRPESISALLERGDALIATAGPFARVGDAAIQAAIAARATYLDSTGEPAFIRRVFERFGPSADRAGSALFTAFGYDYVPGNLAAALAFRQASEPPSRVDIGYFVTGSGSTRAWSRGTLASLAGAAATPGFGFHGGRLVTEPNGRHVRAFELRGKRTSAISVSGSEHYALPRLEPGLREIGVYLGSAGPLTRLMQGVAIPTGAVAGAPLTGPALRALLSRFPSGSGEGPDAATRARVGSHVIAIAYDRGERKLAEVRLDGQNPYAFTAAILAWGAEHAAARGVDGTGALGPVEGFGLETLEDGCREAGLARV